MAEGSQADACERSLMAHYFTADTHLRYDSIRCFFSRPLYHKKDGCSSPGWHPIDWCQ